MRWVTVCKATANPKEGDSHPDRDTQFGYINTQVTMALADAVSDLGRHQEKRTGRDFRNHGREYRPQGNPEEVRRLPAARCPTGSIIWQRIPDG